MTKVLSILVIVWLLSTTVDAMTEETCGGDAEDVCTASHHEGYKELLGHSEWIDIHTSVANVANMEEFRRIMNVIWESYPCDMCRQHFRAYVCATPYVTVTTHKEAILWAWRLHNNVNRRLNKSTWLNITDEEAAYHMLTQEYPRRPSFHERMCKNERKAKEQCSLLTLFTKYARPKTDSIANCCTVH